MAFPIIIPSLSLTIRPLARTEADLAAALEVYHLCGDFLALGPVAQASPEMVLADMDLSKKEGCTFCGIFTLAGELLGVVDFSAGGFQGDPAQALLSLMMIAAPYRGHGIGEVVFRAVEACIRAEGRAYQISAGVQVNNPAAIRFWRRMGFTVGSTAAMQLDGTVTFSMVKELFPAGERRRDHG